MMKTTKRRKQVSAAILCTALTGMLFLSGCSLSGRNLSKEDKLGTAMQTGYRALLEEAIEEGADINKLSLWNGGITENGQYERNPLRVGLWNWINQYMVKDILDAGADVNAYDVQGCPVTFYSAWMDNESLCQLMTQYDADFTLENDRGETILEYYLCTDDSGLRDFFPRRSMVQTLIAHGAPVDEDTYACAVAYGTYHILDLLYPQVKECFSELQACYLTGNIEAGNQLLEKSSDLSEMDASLAAVYGNRKTIDILHKKTIDFFASGDGKKSILELAAWNQNVETVTAMFEISDLPPGYQKNTLETIVYRNDDVALLEYLSDKGAIQISNLTEEQLGNYVEANAIDTVSYILARGYDISAGEAKGYELLNTAIFVGNEEMVKVLLDYGAKPDVVWEEVPEESILFYACDRGESEIVRLLLDHGVNLEMYGEGAMQNAIDSCQVDVMEILAAEGVPITRQMYEETMQYSPSDHVKERVKDWYEKQNQ